MLGYELVEDIIVSANTDRVDFSNIAITEDDDLILVCEVVSGVVSIREILLYVNDDDVQSNYFRQSINAKSTVIASDRANYSSIGLVYPGKMCVLRANVKLTATGKLVALSQATVNAGSSDILINNYGMAHSPSTSPIISLSVRTDVGVNAIGIGSRLQLYKRVAEVIADITVASNTTKVDISGLTIGKTNEYRLISDILANDYINIGLHPNDDFSNNFYRQELNANGAVISANRFNSTQISYGFPNQRSFAISDIKLTNSGFFICISNGIYQYTLPSSMYLSKLYTTSTNAMTSINKLSIVAELSSGIKAGSRFQLIKLK